MTNSTFVANAGRFMVEYAHRQEGLVNGGYVLNAVVRLTTPKGRVFEMCGWNPEYEYDADGVCVEINDTIPYKVETEIAWIKAALSQGLKLEREGWVEIV